MRRMVPGPRVGTTFAGYRIERVIGRGGMSVVLLAEHPRLKSAVALKILSPELAEDEVFRERLIRESRLAASLNHPNAIPIFDTGEEEGVLFISMRYVDGSDLRALLREEGGLSLEQTVAVVAQVAGALDAAHARGLVHRDVKPANILVESSRSHVYVADFGLTKHADARSGATASGFVGTVHYMAPEQIEGRQVDGRADVYALGCVLYECLTGKPPFELENDVAVIWAHMRTEAPRPSDVDHRLPRGLDGVVRRALEKDPADRFGTCGDLAEALAGVAAGARRRRIIPRPRLRRRASPFVRRRWAVPALLGALVGAGAAGAIALTTSLMTDPAARTATVERPRALSAADRGLLPSVPVGLRAKCVHNAPPSPDFDASLWCRVGVGGVDAVRYDLALSGSRMRAQLLADAVAGGLAAFGVPVAPSGRCERGVPGVRDWASLGAAGRLEKTPGSSQQPPRGRLLCTAAANDWAALEWTDTRVDVLSHAFGATVRDLYAWWTQHGGPLIRR
jgi:predicted Ser/Thr protein kinase